MNPEHICPECGAEYTEDEEIDGECPECYVERENRDLEADDDVADALS